MFSARSLLQTVCVLGAIFALAAALNVRTVSRTRLIDLMQASRRVEVQKLRSIPVSLALFAVSLVMMGIAYKLLVDNGLIVAHSACAMYVVADVVEVFGRFEIGATAAFVAACFLVVYGAYFAITYLFARRFTRE